MKVTQQKSDARTRWLNTAISEINAIRVKRNKHADKRATEASAIAKVKQKQRDAVRIERRKAWEEHRELREFTRRQASRGIVRLPPASHGPGTQTCVACGVSQNHSAFESSGRVCNTCYSRGNSMAEGLAALHAARARARKVLKPGELPS